jgi:hypothetical protein
MSPTMGTAKPQRKKLKKMLEEGKSFHSQIGIVDIVAILPTAM